MLRYPGFSSRSTTSFGAWAAIAPRRTAFDRMGSLLIAAGKETRCTLDQTTLMVPKSGSVTANYTCPSNGSNGTNTATATWNPGTFFTPTGSAPGSAAFAFATPTSTVNRTITVSDSYAGMLGTLTAADSPPFTSHTYTYSRTIPIL